MLPLDCLLCITSFIGYTSLAEKIINIFHGYLNDEYIRELFPNVIWDISNNETHDHEQYIQKMEFLDTSKKFGNICSLSRFPNLSWLYLHNYTIPNGTILKGVKLRSLIFTYTSHDKASATNYLNMTKINKLSIRCINDVALKFKFHPILSIDILSVMYNNINILDDLPLPNTQLCYEHNMFHRLHGMDILKIRKYLIKYLSKCKKIQVFGFSLSTDDIIDLSFLPTNITKLIFISQQFEWKNLPNSIKKIEFYDPLISEKVISEIYSKTYLHTNCKITIKDHIIHDIPICLKLTLICCWYKGMIYIKKRKLKSNVEMKDYIKQLEKEIKEKGGKVEQYMSCRQLFI